MWELDHKESWVPKNWCFWTVVLEKTPESHLDWQEVKPVNPKTNQFWIFTGRADAEAEASVLCHLMWRTDSLEKTLMLGKIEGRRRISWTTEDNGGWAGWMVLLTPWTWVLASSRSWWWTRKPGVLQTMGLQRVGHYWATELNWSFIFSHPFMSVLISQKFPQIYFSSRNSLLGFKYFCSIFTLLRSFSLFLLLFFPLFHFYKNIIIYLFYI